MIDPACGTGGFLLSAYKHIIRENSSNYSADSYIPSYARDFETANSVQLQIDGDFKGDELSLTEKQTLMNNINGYDISPDMVRLSLVNGYLHGFPDPKIYEYDSLTDDDKWDETFSVIMANPPFMTPKGGIKPHKRFTIRSNRAEVLFVDYLLEHLTHNGRAGIIVPDGIVNNSSYSGFRKKLVENGLYAVVSLHQYVFKPYAGAKTSILFFDKSLKKQNGLIFFAEIENDGYQKGVQRKAIKENDLPELAKLLQRFKEDPGLIDLSDDTSFGAKVVDINSLDPKKYYHYIDDVCLFPNNYIYENSVAKKRERAKRICDIFKIQKGSLQSTKAEPGEYRFITASDEILTHEEYTHDSEALVIAVAAGGSLGKVHYVNGKFIASDLCLVLTPKNKDKTNLLFYYYYFRNIRSALVKSLAKGVGKQSINKTDFSNFIIDDFDPSLQQKVGLNIAGVQKEISVFSSKISSLENGLIEDFARL